MTTSTQEITEITREESFDDGDDVDVDDKMKTTSTHAR